MPPRANIMDFPITHLMDEASCYQQLLDWLHPGGLVCPRCKSGNAYVQRYYREPVLDYRCKGCGKVYNAFTGTAFQKTPRRPSELVQILRGVAQATPTAQLARELKCSRPALLELRHKLQKNAMTGLDRKPLEDAEVEADEMYKNAGEKGLEHPDPSDPPRRRGNKKQGHGTWQSDRPPMLGAVGRQSKRLRLKLAKRIWAAALLEFVTASTVSGATVYTDEWGGYRGLGREGRRHVAVSHSGPQTTWAKDLDGDGVREAHCNTMEGIWTGLRIFLAPFRGVSKWYLAQYAAIFEWGYNTKRVVGEFIRALVYTKVITNGTT
jgi:transposase-like protein